MINNVVLNGRLTRDPDLRYTSSGVAVATFTVAVDRSFTNAQGERQADFINCVIWRKAAENFANFTHKGSRIGVQGRLQSRSYDNKDGQRVYVTEVVVENFDFLETKAESDRYRQNNPQGAAPQQNNSYSGGSFTPSNQQAADPFGGQQAGNSGAQAPKTQSTQQSSADPFAQSGDTNISDDDLPF